MSDKKYRRMLFDIVSTMSEFDGGLNQESVDDIQYELNQVYEDSETLSTLKMILESDKDTTTKLTEITILIKAHQLNLL